MNTANPASHLSFDDTSIAFAHKSNSQLQKTHLIFWLMNNNTLVNIGTKFLKGALKMGLPIKNLIKSTLFQQFCGGESIEDCQNTINMLAKSGVGTILDYSVEGEDDEIVFDATVEELLRTIEMAHRQPNKIPFSVFKITGIGSASILEKVQAGEALTTEETAAFERIKRRVETLADRAANRRVRLFFDAEESWIQDVIDQLCYDMMRKHNRGDKTIIYNTYQFYRWASLPHLKEITETARREGFTVGGKFVRGAYMEKERRRADEMGYKDPIQPTKEATDHDFDAAVTFALNNLSVLALCLGTHNELSCKKCAEQMSQMGIAKADERIYFAQLLGMSDNISFNMANANYLVAKYVPYGPVEAVMPYLIRRAEENTSIAGQSSREYLLVKSEVERRRRNR